MDTGGESVKRVYCGGDSKLTWWQLVIPQRVYVCLSTRTDVRPNETRQDDTTTTTHDISTKSGGRGGGGAVGGYWVVNPT